MVVGVCGASIFDPTAQTGAWNFIKYSFSSLYFPLDTVATARLGLHRLLVDALFLLHLIPLYRRIDGCGGEHYRERL